MAVEIFSVMKIGVIGLGSIGMRHAKNLITLGHTVVGHDPNEEVCRKFNRCDERASATEEWPEDVHALVIASPTSRHASHLSFACETMKVPVFVEKPIADRMNGLTKLLPANYIKMVGCNLRFHPCVIQVWEWLREGVIGDPLWAQFTLAQKSEKEDYLRDGLLLNWGAHEVDLARYLLGSAILRVCICTDPLIADLILSHPNGVQSTIHLDYVTYPHRRLFYIGGTKGLIAADLERRLVWLNDHTTLKFGGTVNDDYIAEMQSFVHRAGGAATPGATAEDGVATLELLLEAQNGIME